MLRGAPLPVWPERCANLDLPCTGGRLKASGKVLKTKKKSLAARRSLCFILDARL
jgi:hypothetical protein